MSSSPDITESIPHPFSTPVWGTHLRLQKVSIVSLKTSDLVGRGMNEAE